MLNLIRFVFVFFIYSSKLLCDSFLEDSVQMLQEYLRIDTSYPNPNYDQAITFWEKHVASLELPIRSIPGAPIIVITLKGSNESLSSIILLSHLDVVGADKSEWTYDPFAGSIDDNGIIYGRGVQDMKSAAIQHFMALKTLKIRNTKLNRTVHMVLVPDEEIGGEKGMKMFVQSKLFSSLNVGFALGEGIANEGKEMFTLYGDKTPWQFTLTFKGNGGHGSELIQNTATEKLLKVLNKFNKFREEQINKINSTASNDTDDLLTTINLTQLQANSLNANVVPSKIKATFDVRISNQTNIQELNDMISDWADDAGDKDTLHFLRKDPLTPFTNLDHRNIFWKAIKITAEKLGISLVSRVCPAKGDLTELRTIGIPAIGFSPMNETVSKMHSKDEHLNKFVFIHGVDIMTNFVIALGNA